MLGEPERRIGTGRCQEAVEQAVADLGDDRFEAVDLLRGEPGQQHLAERAVLGRVRGDGGETKLISSGRRSLSTTERLENVAVS